MTGENVVLMEDLSSPPSSAIGVNFFFGNQRWGMKPLPEEDRRDPEAVLKDVLSYAARLHAKYWNDSSLLSVKWLKSVNWFHQRDKAMWTLAMRRAQSSWERAKSETLSGCSGWKCSERLIAIVDRSFSLSTWETLQLYLRDRRDAPFTLTHGDFHAANMFWRRGTSSLILVDWSEVGVWDPTTDIGQMMISDIKPQLRRTIERSLLGHYWRELIRGGVSPSEYPFDLCWKSYEVRSVERWIWIFAVIAGLSLPAAAKQYFHDQLLEFINDHGSDPFYILKPVVCVT